MGQRLATSAYAQVYGGSGAATGPTLSGCVADGTTITVQFNTSLLRNEKVVLNPYLLLLLLLRLA